MTKFDYNSLIGKHLNDPACTADSVDWYCRWPQVDEEGIIVAIWDGDTIPDNAILLDNGLNVVDGSNGFDAFRLE
jgi:hypothetical protein